MRGPCAGALFGIGGHGEHLLLVRASDENLVVIAAMLVAPPRRQQKPKVRSSSDRPIRAVTPAPTRQPLGRPPRAP